MAIPTKKVAPVVEEVEETAEGDAPKYNRYPGANNWHGWGNLARDPEVKISQSNNEVITTSLAMTRPMTGGDTAESMFLPIVVFAANNERAAKVLRDYAKKGSGVYVEGMLDINTVEAEDGSKKYYTQVIVDKIFFLPRSGAAKTDDAEETTDTTSAPRRQRQPTTPAPTTRPGGKRMPF